MKKLLTTSIITASLLGLSACTSTLHADYTPKVEKNSTVTANHPFQIMTKDARGGDANLLGQATFTGYLANGTPLTAEHPYSLDQSVSSFMNTALTTALTSEGYKVNTSSPYLLTATILNSKIDFSHGLVENTFTINMQVQMEVTNSKTYQTLWKTTYMAKGVEQESPIEGHDTAVKHALSNTIDNLASQLVNDAQFNRIVN